MIGTRRRARSHLAKDVSATDGRATDFLLDAPVAVVARVAARGRGSIERVEALTPHAVEIIVEDTRAAGRGAVLDVTVRSPMLPGTLTRVRAMFDRLVARGVRVHVSADPIVRRPTFRRPAA